jgi:N-methylhydantoinase A
MADTGLKLESATVKRLADGRFLGQGFNLVVELPEGPYDDGALSRTKLTAAFESAYREKFSLTPPGVAVEFLNIRVSARAPVSGSEVVLQGWKGKGAAAALKGKRPAYFSEAGGFVETAVFDRYRLGVGDELQGPAVLEEEGSTLVVGPGATARVAPTGNVILTLPVRP